MKLTITSLISTDIIAHGFLLDIPERWILVGLVLVHRSLNDATN